MSDAIPLPARPNLEQYRKQAKDLRRESKSTLTAAQFSIARSYGFKSWPIFSKTVRELENAHSPAARFEAAADAIATGDLERLSALLGADPSLARTRSTREHRSTLLHYVSANGIEDYRQKTPPNIVAITRLLLDSGAEVNAESDAYDGRSTALNLTATSVHPERAGVQIPLLELLLERGAEIRAGDIRGCLANGRGQAAEFLASRRGPIDFEEAAGVGRLDLVEALYDSAPPEKRIDGFAWACEYGRTPVVESLLRLGIDPASRQKHGETGLHWAAYSGHPEIVRLLLEHGAPTDLVEDRFSGTPLDWALHASKEHADKTRWDEIVHLLATR